MNLTVHCILDRKLIIYPDGDGSEDGYDHISVYLAIAETNSLQAGWEVNATFSFLIFDQIHDKFLVMRGMEQRFHNINTEWGFPNCISYDTFREPSNGYLVNDKCVFGVDIYVIKNHGVGECVSLLDQSKSYKHEWKISEFTKVTNIVWSEEFAVGDYKWKLQLYPTGVSGQNGQSISIFLESVDAKGFDFRKRVQAKFSISVKDQITGAHHKMTSASSWFAAAGYSWGWRAFMRLSELKDPKKGYLVKDCCIVEADVSVLGVVNSLT
ncbi:ubiquitin carboxyl-terminal hydrolase 13 [Nicotiana attenuata]|uniref:Ubiquitin carboxyl-terminal hydrolase 13 n=1 Tax=Nicotiana attenuata TaxID=49451 RepID=A0A1J6I754_NICAT|nr:ubiquitin carboxyl-terminal hydrolase 13 [Nicotiana attenuata]